LGHAIRAQSNWGCASSFSIVLLYVFVLAGARLAPAETLASLKSAAAKALSAGDLAVALSNLREASRLSPSDAQVQLNLGFTLLRMGNLKEALTPLEKAKHDANLRPEAGFLSGVVYFELRSYQKAISELNGLEGGPHAERVLYMLEESYRLTNQLDLAKQTFRQLNQKYPESAWTHFLMGTAYETQEQLDKAVDEYKQALQKDPSIPNANFAIGYIYWRQQNTEESKKWLQTEASSGCHSLAFYFLGEIARTGKSNQEAERDYRQSLKCDPLYADAHLRLGMVLANDKRYTDAIVQLKEAIRLKPDASAAHYHLATVYRKTGQASKAEAEYAQVRRIQAASGQGMGGMEGAKP
jgi:tetratricopeptide (TPR) repeat protein